MELLNVSTSTGDSECVYMSIRACACKCMCVCVRVFGGIQYMRVSRSAIRKINKFCDSYTNLALLCVYIIIIITQLQVHKSHYMLN